MTSERVINDFMTSFKISRTSAELLHRRNFTLESAERLIFHSTFRRFSETGLADEAKNACHLLTQSKKVGIFCDYDADGIFSSEVLRAYAEALGINHTIHIPERLEGYGLQPEAVRLLHGRGVDTLLTADCGSNDHAGLQEARKRGLKIIVTDHHRYTERPDADAFLNSIGSEFESLCGCAVAGLTFRDLSESTFQHIKPYMAVATIGDIVPLYQESRLLVQEFLNFPTLPGILEAAFNGVDEFTPNTIGFQVIPKINAFSRMGQAREILKVRKRLPKDLAVIMRELNDSRKKTQKKLLKELESTVDTSLEILTLCVPAEYGDIVGFFGLLASRLTDKHSKPSLVGYMKDGKFKGSGRSPGWIDLHAVLGAAQKSYDVEYGGHSVALGFRAADVDGFSSAVNHAFAANRAEFESVRAEVYDFELSSRYLYTLREAFEELQPFGSAFPMIRVKIPDLNVDSFTGSKYFEEVVRGNSIIQVTPPHQRALKWLQRRPKTVYASLDKCRDGKLYYIIDKVESDALPKELPDPAQETRRPTLERPLTARRLRL
jgi:single-stranded-DNA-specific exonuclease